MEVTNSHIQGFDNKKPIGDVQRRGAQVETCLAHAASEGGRDLCLLGDGGGRGMRPRNTRRFARTQ